jgi:hypothetical protein
VRKEMVMKRVMRVVAAAALLGCLTVGTGCASLSLFSSKHDHYYGTKEQDQRIKELEKRMDGLEQR